MMATPCPDPQTLQAFLDGLLADDLASLTDAHISNCQACQNTLDRIGSQLAHQIDQQMARQTVEALQRDLTEDFPALEHLQPIRQLGAGGMGIVYLAEDLHLKRRVAVKVLRSGVLSDDISKKRFQTEAQALARLEHPHIVRVFQFGQLSSGQAYLVLEYLEGDSLRGRLRSGRLFEPNAAAALVEKLADAVHHAHEQGILHRDLKPENILITQGNVPKLIDFGIAKDLQNRSVQLTEEVMGTLPYLAPEQTRVSGSPPGPAIDIHALGVILYEMLSGRAPFRGSSPLETLVQIQRDEPAPLPLLLPRLPRDLATICHHCLHKEPGQRYGSAGELAEDLRRFQRGEAIRARPVSTLERSIRWAYRNPLPVSLIAVSVLALVALLLLGVQRWRIAGFEQERLRRELEARRVAGGLLFEVNRAVRRQVIQEVIDRSVAESQKKYQEHMKLAEKEPKNGLYQAQLGVDLFNLAKTTSAKMGNADQKQAIDIYTQALERYEHAKRLGAQVDRLPILQRNALWNRAAVLALLGRMFQREGKEESARRYFARAMADYNTAVEWVSDKLRNEVRVNRALVIVWLGDHERALAEFESVYDQQPANAEISTRRSHLYSLAIPAVARDGSLTPSERAALAESYARVAMQAVEQAMEQGAFQSRADLNELEFDDIYDSLRDRPEFQRLLEQAREKVAAADPEDDH
jgi:serine/threonine protein kinase